MHWSVIDEMFTGNVVIFLGMVIPMLLQLGGLLIAVFMDSYIQKKHKWVMLVIIILVFSLVAQNLLEDVLAADKQMWFPRRFVAIYGYCIRPVVIVMFLYIINLGHRYTVAWILVGVNAAVQFTSLFSGICFIINEDNHYISGPLGNFCLYVSIALLAYLVFVTLRRFREIRKKGMVIPFVNVAIIIFTTALDDFVGYSMQPVTFLTEGIVSNCVFFYIWLHLQFVREHEQALQAEQRIRIMISRIQPHFLFNTLSTIQAMCDTDPQAAKKQIERFGKYLRQNIDSLSQEHLIPFKKELEHTLVYAEIEMTRFENIKVYYDTPDTDFCLPTLTLQPLVENAIRHGVRIRSEGVVNVITRNTGEYHEILVCDNGKGFDTQLPESSDDTHIGLKNVRERVEEMCGGQMTIESRIGEGTTVTIRLPVG